MNESEIQRHYLIITRYIVITLITQCSPHTEGLNQQQLLHFEIFRLIACHIFGSPHRQNTEGLFEVGICLGFE